MQDTPHAATLLFGYCHSHSSRRQFADPARPLHAAPGCPLYPWHSSPSRPGTPLPFSHWHPPSRLIFPLLSFLFLPSLPLSLSPILFSRLALPFFLYSTSPIYSAPFPFPFLVSSLSTLPLLFPPGTPLFLFSLSLLLTFLSPLSSSRPHAPALLSHSSFFTYMTLPIPSRPWHSPHLFPFLPSF